MLKVGDNLRVLGGTDRQGKPIPEATWTVVALDRIEGSPMHACLARGDRPDRPRRDRGRPVL